MENITYKYQCIINKFILLNENNNSNFINKFDDNIDDYIEFYNYIQKYNDYIINNKLKLKLFDNNMFISYIILLNINSYNQEKLKKLADAVKFNKYTYNINIISKILDKKGYKNDINITLTRNNYYDIIKICNDLNINYNRYGKYDINFNNLTLFDLMYINEHINKYLYEQCVLKIFAFIIDNEYFDYGNIFLKHNKIQLLLYKCNVQNYKIHLYLYFTYGILNINCLYYIVKNNIEYLEYCYKFIKFNNYTINFELLTNNIIAIKQNIK